MADIYMNLDYDDYKELEEQLSAWTERETAHTTVTGFYHKSISFRVAGVRFEFHGPIVKAAEPAALRCPSMNPTRPDEQCTLPEGHPGKHNALMETGAWT